MLSVEEWLSQTNQDRHIRMRWCCLTYLQCHASFGGISSIASIDRHFSTIHFIYISWCNHKSCVCAEIIWLPLASSSSSSSPFRTLVHHHQHLLSFTHWQAIPFFLYLLERSIWHVKTFFFVVHRSELKVESEWNCILSPPFFLFEWQVFLLGATDSKQRHYANLSDRVLDVGARLGSEEFV